MSKLVEVIDKAHLPTPGSKLERYIDISTGIEYRWTGSGYAVIGSTSDAVTPVQAVTGPNGKISTTADSVDISPGWQLLQDIVLAADTNVIDITGLSAYAGCSMFMVEGLLVPDTSPVYPTFQLNGVTTANYAYLIGDFTSTGLSVTNHAPAGGEVTEVNFGPALSSTEQCYLKMIVGGAVNSVGNLLMNTELRPQANDWHITGGSLNGQVAGTPLDSIKLYSGAPFGANLYKVGTHFKVTGFF